MHADAAVHPLCAGELFSPHFKLGEPCLEELVEMAQDQDDNTGFDDPDAIPEQRKAIEGRLEVQDQQTGPLHDNCERQPICHASLSALL
jgi:hypothetical protein